MKLRSIITILLILSFFLVPNSRALAILSISDSLSTVVPNVVANHDIKWSVADGGGIAEGQSFTISFPSEFNSASITSGDVDISDNGGDLSLSGDCSGSEKVGFVNNGDDTLSFSICSGDGGAIAAGHTVEVKIGTNATGGSHQIVNPAAGGYIIHMDGSAGYSDSDKTQVVILSGIGTSAYFAGPTGNLRIIGFASPGALIFFIEGGSTLGTQVADGSSVFDKTLTGLDPGIHSISIYGTDSGARNTLTIGFDVNVISGATTIVSGIILPPTISIAGLQVNRPAALTANGMAKNNSIVQVFIVGSGDNRTDSIPTDAAGNWSDNVNPRLHLGGKQTYSLALDGLGGISEFSQSKNYDVLLSADLNNDSSVNLYDFSILMFNYGTGSPPNVLADINDNSLVDLVDFSVMMYYWNG